MSARILAVGATALVGGAPVALASPHSEVASAFDAEDRFDLHLTLEYGLELHRAGIRREQSGLPGTQPTDPVPVVRDLYFEGARHLVVPRLDLGLFTDFSFTAALPVVISDSRSVLLDQRNTPCVFPGGGAPATCIDRTNSSTIADGILPANGYDAENPGGPGFAAGATLFRGPARAGLDQVHLGLVWAPMNQDRDDTKPTWKLGAEGRLAIGAPMRLNVQNPDSETSVGRGVHEVHAWTSFARRLRWAEPFMKIWWVAPVTETGDSAFRPLGFGEERSAAQQRAGVDFGLESQIWGQPERRVMANLGARIEGSFEGRAYTEMWEVFQYAGTAGGGGPLVLDADPTQAGSQALTHPGITTVENHLRMGGDLGVRAELGKLQVGLSFALVYTQPHLISFSDAGTDLPTCGEPGVSGPCETANNALVNAGTAEVNPGYAPVVDLVGQRYRIDEVFDYALGIEARMLF